MLVIGLTGGIGSGKTTVANCFAELGVPIIDTDIIAREVVAPGSPALETIRAHFGPEAINQDGSLNRGHMRELIFEDASKKAWLEARLHPLIRAETKRQIEQTQAPYCIVVIPLLAETAPNPLIDRVLVVDIDEATQLERASKRDNADKQQIAQIMAGQVSREARLAIGDDVIHNDQDIEHLRNQAKKLHKKYIKIK